MSSADEVKRIMRLVAVLEQIRGNVATFERGIADETARAAEVAANLGILHKGIEGERTREGLVLGEIRRHLAKLPATAVAAYPQLVKLSRAGEG